MIALVPRDALPLSMSKDRTAETLVATSVAVAGAKVASIDAALLVASKLIKFYRAVHASAPTPFPIRTARLLS
jgi:hypothetical protein